MSTKPDDRAVELLGLLHEPQSLAVAFPAWGPKLRLKRSVRSLPFSMAMTVTGISAAMPHRPQWRSHRQAPVAVQLNKVMEDRADIVRTGGTSRWRGGLNPLIGGRRLRLRAARRPHTGLVALLFPGDRLIDFFPGVNLQQLGEHILLLLAGNNGVHKAMLYLKFCPLEAIGQLFCGWSVQ